MHNYTAHSLSSHLRQMVTCKRLSFSIMRPVLGPVFFFLACLVSFSTEASFKIAILDTGFCPEEIKVQSTIEIKPPTDVLGKVVLRCADYTVEQKKSSKRFHGQWVLEQFLASYQGKASLTIHPYIVFNEKGAQTQEAWLKTMAEIKKQNVDVVIVAAGLPTLTAITKSLPGVWIVASGRVEGKMTKETSLFPQMLAPLQNLVLIGSYMEGRAGQSDLFDQNLLYVDKIDFFKPAGSGHFQGTSYAVAMAAGEALTNCTPKKLKACLLSRSIKKRDSLLKKDFLTF